MDYNTILHSLYMDASKYGKEKEFIKAILEYAEELENTTNLCELMCD